MSDLRRTPLYDAHVAAGAKLVPFAGFEMPIQYPTGITAEHNAVRNAAGLFDVSHMGPSFLSLNAPSGDAEADHAAISAIIEPLICGDIAGLKPGQMRYTLLLNDRGGILGREAVPVVYDVNTWQDEAVSLTGLQYQGLGSITFRIYYNGDFGPEGLWDNIVLNGTAVVPEPAALSVLALGGMIVLARRRRRA